MLEKLFLEAVFYLDQQYYKPQWASACALSFNQTCTHQVHANKRSFFHLLKPSQLTGGVIFWCFISLVIAKMCLDLFGCSKSRARHQCVVNTIVITSLHHCQQRPVWKVFISVLHNYATAVCAGPRCYIQYTAIPSLST